MSKTKQVPIEDLHLDLKNFRTVEQPSEVEAVKAMVSISPDRFWALMESLLDDGYLPTENIIAIMDSTGKKMIVKEGNRRIAVLKLIYGFIDGSKVNLPAAIQSKIANASSYWKAGNKKVPCTVFENTDGQLVDKIVTMAHGKGEKASRDPWTSIAKARHNRDINKASEPGLDLLEKYLKQGRNLTGQQKERFAGDYPLSILDAAIQKLYPRLGAVSPIDLVSKYPRNPHVNALEDILLNIGLGQISFVILRNAAIDFAVKFGLPPIPQQVVIQPPVVSPSIPTPSTTPTAAASTVTSPSSTPYTSTVTPPTPSPGTSSVAPITPNPGIPAAAMNTPKSVMNKMKLFTPIGANRDKVVTLRDEILNLDLTKTPIAFCFILRSLFEISAKAYCIDKSIPYASNGKDRKLIDLLKDVAKDITGNIPTHPKTKVLHGALTQLAVPVGILSVTSMNALVHNPSFSVTSTDICGLFNNIYPLLEEMN